MAAPRKYPDELRERAARLAVEARQDPDRKAGALQRIGEQLGITPGDAAQNNAPYGPLSEAHRTQSGAPHREQSRKPEERCSGTPHPAISLHPWSPTPGRATTTPGDPTHRPGASRITSPT